MAGSRWHLCLALAVDPLGQRRTPNMGQVGITPLVLHPPREVTPMAGAAGIRGEAEERSSVGSLHAAPPALGSPKYGCWEMGDIEGSQEKRCSGVLWC